jgi:hypothetical protein
MGRQNIMVVSTWWSKAVHLMVDRREREREEGKEGGRERERRYTVQE